jgi:hypothetical protein
MIGNVELGAPINAVPVAGSGNEAFSRANRRNTALLRRHLGRGTP